MLIKARLPMPSEYGFKFYEILNCNYNPDSQMFQVLSAKEKEQFRKVHTITEDMVIIKDPPSIYNRETDSYISRTWPMKKSEFLAKYGKLPKRSYAFETMGIEDKS